MKTKKIEKKLTFKRETISNLGEGMKNIVAGGVTETCVTCVITCEPCPESMDTCVSCLWIGTVCQAW